MSNLWFNIRFGTYYWQWGPDGMNCRRNLEQIRWKKEEPETWNRFAIYTFFGKHL